jgi:multiple sugar transport system permease protein
MIGKIGKIALYIFCVLLVVMCTIPFVIMFINATKSPFDLVHETGFLANFIPGSNLAANWNHLMTADVVGFTIGRAFLNSFIIAVGATCFSVYVSALTAYAFTVYKFRGNKVLFAVILITMMIPAQTSIVAFIDLMYDFGWTNGWRSFLPLIIPGAAAPATVFFFRQYMMAILPLEMVQAGRIDGCSEFGVFNRLAIPVLKPGIATMAIFAMVGSWNNLFTPMILLSGEWRTVPVYVSLLSGSRHHIEVGAIFLGLSLTAIPLLIFYLLLSKHIIAGITLGSIKE